MMEGLFFFTCGLFEILALRLRTVSSGALFYLTRTYLVYLI